MLNQDSSITALSIADVVADKNVEQQNCMVTAGTVSEVNNLGKELVIPEGYEFLPSEFFPYEGILAPLVSKSWLELIRKKLEEDEVSNYSSEEESEEDTISLAELKNKLQQVSQTPKKRGHSKVKNKSKHKVKKKNKPNQKEPKRKYPLINRKRGRPRKSIENKNSETKLDNECVEEVSSKNEKDPWEDQTNSSILDFLWEEEEEKEEVNSPEKKTEEENGVKEVLYKEHDYFKPNVNYSEENRTQLENTDSSKNQIASGNQKTSASKSNFPCLECGKSFSASSTLKNHQRIHNGTLVKCPECHKGFMTKYLLKCHMRIHSGDLFMCQKCNKGFTTAELLKVHNRCHTGDRPFVCNICGRSFPCASNLSQHKQTHDSEKKFLCSHCGSSFSQKRCLDGHMLTHSEKNHICTVCGKLWARKPDLVEHMRVHTGVKPYCCSVCPQKFTQASSLKRHQIVHTDVKPIQCSTCNKMFKCQDYYKRHVKKHEKESPYLII